MLQQDDLSVVETVMRNVVVFARMKSHQKGQVMDLLGEQGLHQIFKGQPRHVPVSPITKIRKTKKGEVYAFHRSQWEPPKAAAQSTPSQASNRTT